MLSNILSIHVLTKLKWITGAICIALTLPAAGQTVHFSYETHYGISQIQADGTNLLQGCGFGFIGSKTGADDENNITSCHHNNGGVMRPFNLQGPLHLDHQLHFVRPGNHPRRLEFGGQWGPSDYNFATLSMPCDGRASQFTHWRDSSGAMGRYADNPIRYYHDDGTPVRIHFPSGHHSWGEMIGPEYTVRVVVTGTTRPLQLAFVDHPAIGVRNVEFGWIGGAPIGQSANITGYVEVYKTDPDVFGGGEQPTLTFQAESHGWHEIGRRQGDGWSVNVSDPTNRFMNYGPYTTDVVAGQRRARFRLKLDNVTADNRKIVTLDVYNANTGQVVAQRTLRRQEFNRANRYQGFDVNFTAPPGGRFEFRVFYRGHSYVKLDRVRVF